MDRWSGIKKLLQDNPGVIGQASHIAHWLPRQEYILEASIGGGRASVVGLYMGMIVGSPSLEKALFSCTDVAGFELSDEEFATLERAVEDYIIFSGGRQRTVVFPH